MTISDKAIAQLISEVKEVPKNYQQRLRPRAKRGHRERELDITGAGGSRFQLRIRQSIPNPDDFSVILGYIVPGTNRFFRLRRYNSRSHWHTNKIEGCRFWDFHIHFATERYQRKGLDEDGFAKPTERYSDLHSALQCMLDDCSFRLPPASQMTLF